LRVFWQFYKIVAFVTLIVAVLKYTPLPGSQGRETLLSFLAHQIAPLMRLVGLPGDSALALISGMLTGIYGGVAVIEQINLTQPQLTLLALMLLICHNLPAETFVFARIAKKPIWLMWLRIAAMITVAATLHPILTPNSPAEAASNLPPRVVTLTRAVTETGLGLLNLFAKIGAILIGIQVVLEFARQRGWVDWLVTRTHPWLRWMGFSKESAVPLLGGFIFGIIYGAAMIQEEAKQAELPQKQVGLIGAFQSMFHAPIEDTLVFLVLQANLFWITVPRLILACAVCAVTHWLWREKSAPCHPIAVTDSDASEIQ
jgi:hypothetical protein